MFGLELSAVGSAALTLIIYTVAGLIVDQVLQSVLRNRSRSGSGALREFATGVHWLPTSLGVLFGLWQAIDLLGLRASWAVRAAQLEQAAAIVIVTAFSARILGKLIRMYTSREDTPLPSTSILINLARGVVWTLGGLSVLATFGVSIAPLLTALGIGGLAVGLALQPTLENLFSGIQLLASKQIKPGDYIRLDTGDEGTVLDITWRDTSVRKPSNDVVIVPNSVLARATVTNFSTLDPEFVLLVPVTVASAGDPDEVLRIAREVAEGVVADTEGAVRDSEVGVRFAEFAPPTAVVNVTVRCVNYQERIGVRDELIRRMARRFADEGVQAPPVAMAPGATRQR